ncbi:MAG TPA: response regulator [Dehalococcoidia bacterium]|nr:response regulator [Dehalococcoidia bacterium]
MRTDGLISLILLDDHETARAALAARLAKTGRVDLVGETADPCEALRIIAEKRPHAALVDPRRQDGHGFAALAIICGAAVDGYPVVAVHTSYYDAEEWLRARDAGARDWLLKQLDVESLITRVAALLNRDRLT